MGSPVFWGRSSGGSGAINIPDDYFFEDTTARDSYFTTNPTELVEGVQVVVGTTTLQLQEYRSSAWVDLTPVVRGPAGTNGTNGTDGTNGTNGSNGVGVPTGGSGGQILKKVDASDFNTTWGDTVDADALVYKGAIDCSTNPNYPAADAGDTYKASSAGHIGGASGPSVAVGDLIICSVDSTATGDHATVGSHWSVIGATTEGGGGTGISWTEITGTSQTAAADNGYITNNESLVTVTLPSTCAVGKTICVAGKGSGLWKIAQNAGQQIIFGNKNSTSGTSGYIASLYQYDSVELLCITADTVFSVIGAVGDLDVV